MTKKEKKKSIEKSSDSSGSRKPSPSPSEHDLNVDDAHFLLSPHPSGDRFQTPAPIQERDVEMERIKEENRELRKFCEMLNTRMNKIVSISKEPEDKNLS